MEISKYSTLKIDGRILYLTEDSSLLKDQLRGDKISIDIELTKLIDNISTDEITPGWVCYYYDDTLARYCLVGLRGGEIKIDAIKNSNFSVIVSGRSKGCGSSRETAPFSELEAGIQLVIAKSIEKIYSQNSQNIGLLTSTDFSLIERIEKGDSIEISEFTKGLDPISKEVVEYGGLFQYNRARLAGKTTVLKVETKHRGMTLCEKIIAKHVVVDALDHKIGVEYVKPSDAVFIRTDVRFSHEYVTPMAEVLFCKGFGRDAKVSHPESVYAFRDHLTFLDQVISQEHIKLGLREQAQSLAAVQESFVKRQGIRYFGEVIREGKTVGSEAICHNKIIEAIAFPGQVVLGTDSHTCMAGALGCFAFGVGSTDMANAWLTQDVRVAVPQSVQFCLMGKLKEGVCAKDLILYMLSQPFWKSGDGIGKVLEFCGPGVKTLNIDERSTLTNMAVEAGGFTGIIEADEVVVDYLVHQRGIQEHEIQNMIVKADPDAEYFARFEMDLSLIEPMIAKPGDPRNGIELKRLYEEGEVKISIAYGGSCTGGKKTDMDMYAKVLKQALTKGKKVSEDVQFYIQFGSQEIRSYSLTQGYLDIFERAGAKLVDPSCGACIKAGPGVSFTADEVTISAINRNFPGRSGPGNVYLASPLVVAASAVAGKICGPEDI